MTDSATTSDTVSPDTRVGWAAVYVESSAPGFKS